MFPSHISVFFGHMASNIGDLAINQGQMSLLSRAFPNAQINIVILSSKSRNYFSECLLSLGNKFFSITVFEDSKKKLENYIFNPSLFLKDCNAENSELIILASGEFLFSYNDNKNIKNLFWRTLPIIAAKTTNKQSILLPSTFGPFEGDSTKFIVKTLELTNYIAFRDIISTQYFSELTSVKTLTLLDPAFFLEQDKKAVNNQINTIELPENHLAIAMRSEGWGIRLSKNKKNMDTKSFKLNKYCNSKAYTFTKFLCEQYLTQENSKIVIYIQTTADQELADFIYSAIIKNNADYQKRLFLYRPTSVEDYLNKLSYAQCMIASRFHAIILSLTVNKPVYGVYFDSHGHKIPGLFNFIGIPKKCFNLSKLFHEYTVDKILDDLANNSNLIDPLLSHIQELRKKTIDWLKSITDKQQASENQLDNLKIYMNFISKYFTEI